MDNDTPGLAVGFQIDTGSSFEQLIRLDDQIDRGTANALRAFADIERASGGMLKLGGATAEISAFGAAATREGQAAAREFSRIEKSGEALVRQLERQNAAYGLTRAELRQLRAEEAALAADRVGNADLAARIRAVEAGLFDKELAAGRSARVAAEAEIEAATEARAEAAKVAAAEEVRAQAAVIDQLRARAQMEDLLYRNFGVGQGRATDLGATFSALAEREREAEAVEKRAEAERLVNSQLAERARLEAALARDTGLGQPRAVDNGATFSALAAREIAAQEQALREAAFAHDLFNRRVREGVDAMRAEEAAAAELARVQATQASSVSSLRSAVDPLHGQQERLAQQLQSAIRLYRDGVIGQDEYARSSQALAERIDAVQRAQARQNDTLGDPRPGLQAADLTNIMFQVQDIFVSLAGGQNPLMVLIQQGSQLGGIMAQTGVGVGGMARAIGGLLIVSRPTEAALAAVAASQATLATATTAATTAGARAAVAQAELAVAEELAARAGTADGAAQQRLTLAQAEQAATAEVAAAANRQLALAQTGAGNAAAAASATAMRALAPWAAMLVAVTAPLAVAGVALWRFNKEIENDAGLKKYAASLGATKKEVEGLKDVSVTAGDMMGGLWDTIDQRLQAKANGKRLIDYLFAPGDAKIAANFAAEVYGVIAGAYDGIVATWALMPDRLRETFGRATNEAIGAAEKMVNGSIGAINALLERSNAIIGTSFGQIAQVQIARVNEGAGNAGERMVAAYADGFKRRKAEALGAMDRFADDWAGNSVRRARDRIKKQVDNDDKPDRHAEQLAREAAAMEAQIRNLYLLADAYGVSGAAALIAEARVKAESAAIKKRADIEALVDRQIRLAIAERVVDAAKSTASARDQAAAQEAVNAMVAAGLVPAERAGELVRDRIADLPLLAAIEAAQQRGLATEAARATKALADQRGERERLARAVSMDRFNAATAAGVDRLALIREETRLVGANEGAQRRALALIRATQEASAERFDPERATRFIAQQVEIADAEFQRQLRADAFNESLNYQADLLAALADNASRAGQVMADAFGAAGQALGGLASTFAGYLADQARLSTARERELAIAGQITDVEKRSQRERQINGLYAARNGQAQVALFGDMAAAARGFFKEGSDGYRALATAEQVFRAVQFAMSVKAVAMDAAETASSIAKSGARAVAHGVEAVAKAIASLPFPANLAAGAATVAALAAIGISVAGGLGGSGRTAEEPNASIGTVLGDASAKSESIKRAIDTLREVDTVTSVYARQMADSLRSIDGQISGVAAQIVRGGDINASTGITEGFKANLVGSVLGAIPLVGGLLKSLFGSTTTVTGSGLYSSAQSVGDILAGGFDASTYSDVQKKSKLFGITTGTKTLTQYGAADPALEAQFGLLIRSFSDAIAAAAGPLGQTAEDVASRINGVTVSLGKIDTKGLTGAELEEKLAAVFGAAADNMAAAAIPGIERFQKVGEGAFETLVRVASTVEAVTTSLDKLGAGALGLDAKLDLVGRFDSIGDLTSAADSYLSAFYTREEQAAAEQAQLARVFASLGMVLPTTLSGFRNLVEAQDLTTEAGRATYATLLQLAPAFADLQSALMGAKSAADIVAERQDLERKLLELSGDTAALRALDLAKLDASNRALQVQVWAVEDAQAAAKAAEDLRDAWRSVGDTLLDEVRRIRGLTGTDVGGSFAALMDQFNAATAAARGGDMDAAKSLPSLSQALLKAAEDQATSRQELARVQAQTAASLEATYGVVGAIAARAGAAATTSTGALSAAALASQPASTTTAANDDSAAEMRALREEVAGMRRDLNTGQAAIIANTGRSARVLEDVSGPNGGDALSIASAA